MKITLIPKKERSTPLVRLVEKKNPLKPLQIEKDGGQRPGRRGLIIAARKVVMQAKQLRLSHIALNLTDFRFPQAHITDQELVELLTTNFLMANYEFVYYKTKPKEGWRTVQKIDLIAPRATSAEKEGIRRGVLIGNQINECRTLANTRAADLTPRMLAEAAMQAAGHTDIKVKVLKRKEMEALGMHAVLKVAQGSGEEPAFIVMEYLPRGEKERPIVLVGKGVTFDSGGINIKTSDWLQIMHLDMSGGGSVIHAITLAAKLKMQKNIIALIPAVENMVSGASYHTGDIIRTMAGKTVEVTNTDAEGRLILADAITYARKYRPRLIIDVATLTGSAILALGNHASALFTPDEDLESRIRRLGEESGDYVWPLPLWKEYEEDLKTPYADLANAPKHKYAGAINGAIFLYQFTGNTPWVHLDTAPRFTATENEYLAKGATGTPIRLLIKLLEQY